MRPLAVSRPVGLRMRGQALSSSLPPLAFSRRRRLQSGGGLRINAAAEEPRLAKKALVVGGSGRVGGSTVRWLSQFAAEEGVTLQVAVGGRSRANFDSAVRRMEQQDGGLASPVSFVRLDLTTPSELDAALAGMDLVVHTAGPFQFKEHPEVLESAIRCGVPYLDVCDDTELCQKAKDLQPKVAGAGVPAIVSAGIWPGVSALMLAEAVDRLKAEGGEGTRIDSAHMSFYTAGTGNAGATIVSATFLLLAMDALTFVQGRRTPVEAWTADRLVDFGPGAGRRRVWLLDNPEVYTCHQVLGIPNFSSSFGTAPGIWNLLFGTMKLLPTTFLANQSLMQRFSIFSEPIIRAVDAVVGATNAMRMDVTTADGRELCLRVTHEDLEQAVGIATAAFGMEILLGTVEPGVWFPVELKEQRAAIFKRSKRGTVLWEV